MELQLDDGPRSSLSIGLEFGRYSGISLEFARRFTKGIGKLAGNMSGDYQKKTIGLAARMPEAAGLAGRVNRFGLHPKKIGSIRQRASRRRTREWT
ncbi:hypothetical protein GW17_00028980 [Ensete ventricosum]|nr:hypothetical protein GW17_00028980 [Ensete ventricosum]